jgi:hypothetical protein
MYLLRHRPAEKYRPSHRQIAAKSEWENRRRHMDAAGFPKSRNDLEMKPARHRACLPRPKPGARRARSCYRNSDLAPRERNDSAEWSRSITAAGLSLGTKKPFQKLESKWSGRIEARIGLPTVNDIKALRQIVSKWRRRFHVQRLAGLEEKPRGGRQARFSPQCHGRNLGFGL